MTDVPPLSVALLVAVLGLFVGSFLNVVIYRVPREESVVRPRSRCPGCQTQLTWYENVPVASWVALRGRCRTCSDPVSVWPFGALNGTDSTPLTPNPRAACDHSGHRMSAVRSGTVTSSAACTAVRHGPLTRSYWSRSALAAESSVA